MLTLSSNYMIGINLRWGRFADLSSTYLEAVYSGVDFTLHPEPTVKHLVSLLL
jgi:hypothetical protein